MPPVPYSTPPEPTPVALQDWSRREHFAFYNQFTEPFFSVTAEVRCGALVRACREQGLSPTLRLWHGVLRAANEIDAFTLRVVGGRPVRFPRIHLSPTVLRADETFAITFLPFLESFAEFEQVAAEVIAEARASKGLKLDLAQRRVDLIHFSTLPWFRFTSLTHARYMLEPESEPKVTLGKFGSRGDEELWLPVSVTVHHGLTDGLHVARFLERLEANYAEPVCPSEG